MLTDYTPTPSFDNLMNLLNTTLMPTPPPAKYSYSPDVIYHEAVASLKKMLEAFKAQYPSVKLYGGINVLDCPETFVQSFPNHVTDVPYMTYANILECDEVDITVYGKKKSAVTTAEDGD